MVPVLAMALSLIDLIRRNELSLSTGHPMLLVVYAALGGALTLCVLLTTASKETIAAFLFVACTAMQCVRLLLYCSLSAADLALLLPLRERLATSIPVVICYYLVQGGFQGCYPFPDEVLWPCTCTLCTHASAPSVRALTWTPRMHIACAQARCGRSLATFLATQASICLVWYLRTARLAALTVSLPCTAGAFALAFGLARLASRVPRAVQQHGQSVLVVRPALAQGGWSPGPRGESPRRSGAEGWLARLRRSALAPAQHRRLHCVFIVSDHPPGAVPPRGVHHAWRIA